MIIEIAGKRVEVDDSFADLSPEEQQAQVNLIASQMGEGARSSDEESAIHDMMKPIAGAAAGTLTGAVTGPAVGKAVDIAATKAAEKVTGPKGTPRRDSVEKWLAKETTGPFVGGATKEEAYKKSEIARGKPVQSRGSQVPIRKGFLGIQNQPEPPSLPQKAAANIIAGEKLGTPSIPRRIGGMGVAGAEAGKMASDIEQGNILDAIISGIGAAGGAMSQSRIKPIRAIGTGLSVLVPTAQGASAVKDIVSPSEPEEKAAGGLISLAKGGKTTPAWQRKEGKSPSGGLNAVGRASYKRETGGTLKAPQPEGGSRKKSFCARMGGMKKKLTSSKTANDPDSRINKALRKWKC